MRLLILTLLFVFLSTSGFTEDWTGITECGIYEVRGVARKTKNGPVIIVNEKSQSEMTISVPISNEAKLAPYIDKALIAHVSIDKKPVGAKLQGNVTNIYSRISNPLDPRETFIKIISKVECKK